MPGLMPIGECFTVSARQTVWKKSEVLQNGWHMSDTWQALIAVASRDGSGIAFLRDSESASGL